MMVSANTYSGRITEEDRSKLRRLLEGRGFNFFEMEHTVYAARSELLTVIVYKSGKIVVQGSGAENFVEEYLGVPNPFNKQKQRNLGWDRSHWTTWIGTDESGKGDYFGPLVIAAVVVDINDMDLLKGVGVKDSKRISDKEIKKLAALLKSQLPHKIVIIGVERYNTLYKEIANVNEMLAWGHARAIEDILNKRSCNFALTDQFGNQKLVERRLMEKGKKIELHQEPKAESDVAVAAASILARDEFLSGLRTLSVKFKMVFAKGAGKEVEKNAKRFVEKYGREKLNMVAKVHFRTTDKVLWDKG